MDPRKAIDSFKLLQAIDSLSEAFAVYDADDRLVMCNERYVASHPYFDGREALCGVTFEALLRAALANRAIIEPRALDDPEAWLAERLARHRDPPDTPLERELADGRWLQISEHRTPDGGIVVVQTDITALKKQEAYFRRYVDELMLTRERLEEQGEQLVQLAEDLAVERDRAQAANVAKSQFLATMSHELRTPLNAILGFSEVYRMALFGPMDGKYREYAEDIHRSGTLLLDLIGDILDMSRIELGHYRIHPEPVDIGALSGECVRLVEGRARDTGLTLSAEVAGNAALNADRRALKQVLINLLTNAVKFTPAGGTVSLDICATAQGVTIEVSDTGIGIAEDDLPRILEPFVQAKRGKSGTAHEGAGLGLALSKSLVELHGGTLSIASSLGHGTAVRIHLPSGDAEAGRVA